MPGYNNNWAKIDWPDSAYPIGRDLNDLGKSIRIWGWGQTPGTITIDANSNNLTSLNRLSTADAYFGANIAFRLTNAASSGVNYWENQGTHLARYRKRGLLGDYWRITDSGLVGGPNEITLMSLDDNGLLSVYSTVSAPLLTVPSGGHIYVNHLGAGGTPTVPLAVGDTDTGLDSPSDGVLLLKTNGSTRLTLYNNGYIGHAPPGNFADNAAAVAAGLGVGTWYRSGDFLKVVH